MNEPKPEAAMATGRAFFGIGVTASGILQLVTGDFVRLVPKLPSWIPAPSVWPYLFGVILVVTGLAILIDRRTRPAAAVVGVLILLVLVFLCLPELVVTPGMERPYLRGFMWTKPLKALALIGAAALLAQSPSARSLGAALLALFFIVGGVQHFVYNDFVTQLVPSWMPARRFWAYFTGVALIAGGLGMLVPRTARLAAALSALMIFLWVLTLHIPRAIALPQHAFETAGVFEALALSGAALLVAATRARSATGARLPPGP
jgi:uncharacterized membrane protein